MSHLESTTTVVFAIRCCEKVVTWVGSMPKQGLFKDVIRGAMNFHVINTLHSYHQHSN